MNRRFLKTIAVAVVFLFTVQPVLATCGGGGGGGAGGIGIGPAGSRATYSLPWMLAGPGVTSGPPGAELVLYWFPTSREQALSAELIESRTLLGYAKRCLVFALITSENELLSARFEATGRKPVAMLADGDGVVIATLEAGGRDKLKRKDVEKLIKAHYETGKDVIEDQLDNAKRKAKSGATGDAVALYEGVWEQRCMFPDKAKNAAKELRKLGVTVGNDNAPLAELMDVSETTNERADELMGDGVQAEEAGDYDTALANYQAARRLDPADPVPLRYLGELYRHHTGEWDKAAEVFEQILAAPSDPISRAVAQHGLGKMTIHGGEFEKGLRMIEASIETYPLALAYRNLAVYWNSEEDFEKAYGYAQQALALQPDDPYNIVFAATYLVGMGQREEAVRIATEHADLLAGSYNLAAIHALAGNRDQALELLRRHFYDYESNDRVRVKEMWEARDDFVFAALADDPDFIQLTSLATQHGGTP